MAHLRMLAHHNEDMSMVTWIIDVRFGSVCLLALCALNIDWQL